MTSLGNSAERRGAGNIPFRLRLRDAAGETGSPPKVADNTTDDTMAIEERSQSMDDRLNMFLNEFFSKAKNEEALQMSCTSCKKAKEMKPSMQSNVDDNTNKKKHDTPVWVSALNLWLSPAKAAIFEKHWGELSLGERHFTSDPAPHIPRCSHCKLSVVPNNLQEENLKKKAIEAQVRLEQLRQKYKQQELREVKEINERLAAFRNMVRKNAENVQVEKSNRVDYLKPIIVKGKEEKKPLRERVKAVSRKKANIPKVENDSKTSSTQPKDSSDRRKKSRALSKKSKKRSSVSSTEISHPLPRIPPRYDVSAEMKVDEELQRLQNIEANDSISSAESSEDLDPVELPDWVVEYMKKKKAAEEEAAKRRESMPMPIPVYVESINEEGEIERTEAVISMAPHRMSKDLDWEMAAAVMSKATPIPFGMENGDILPMQITASSSRGPFHPPSEARLNNEPRGKNVGAWCPKKHNTDQWLQIDFGKERNIQQIATQGMPIASVRRPKDKRWVEAFTLSYSDDEENWKDYTDDNGNPKVFKGNNDLVNTATNSLDSVLKTRFIRIHPISWNTGIALRIEIYGETEEPVFSEPTFSEPSQDVECQELGSITEIDSVGGIDRKESHAESEYVLLDENNNVDEHEDDIDGGEAQAAVGASARASIVQASAQASASTIEQADADLLPEEFEYPVFDDEPHDDLKSELPVPTAEEQETLSEVSKNAQTPVEDYEAMEEEDSSEADKLPPIMSLKRQKIIEANELQRKVKDMMEKQKAGQRLHKPRSVKENVMEMGRKGADIFHVEEEKDDFLSQYCILKESQKVLYARVFHKFDDNCDGLIDRDDLTMALKALNLNALKEEEVKYIMKIIDVFEDSNQDGITAKTFNVIAAFSDRLKNVDTVTRGMIRETNFAKLYLHAHRTRDLFERMLERGETTISAEQFLIELEAAGVKSESQYLVRTYTKRKQYLDFLDFAIYFPLFLYTHEKIMSYPL